MTTDSIDPGPLDPAPPVSAELRPCASYTLRVNGFERPVTDAWIGESLLYVLRERLGLAGAKDGCEQGECGACSVQVDGQLVAGCLVPAALAADSEINTVEGLSAGGAASDVQLALAESGAVQCGYCTPGMAMAVHDLLQRNHRPSEVEARQALCGNLCRCTGYRGVLAAVQSVADARALEAEAELEPDAADEAEPAAGQPSAPAAEPAAPPAAPPAAQSAADLPLAGELPVYADSEAWVEHIPQQSAAQVPAAAEHATEYMAEYATQPTAAGTGVGVGMEYGYDGVYDTGVLPPITGIPAQHAPQHHTPQQHVPQHHAPQQGQYPQPGQFPQPGYAEAPFQGTPAHGTYLPDQPYEGGVPYEGQGHYEGGTPYLGVPYQQVPQMPPMQPMPQMHGGYDGPVYEGTPAHGTAFDGPGPEGTPAHGTPYIPTPPHGVPTDAGHGIPYGATPAHGTPIPEDRHA
ncbi:(2Fe-2S)-binding protein [Kitasatospora sp. NPDC050543]|uniref:(2Fe-2S)-binding protein n=1 Tax=Kitasatospora sp. NPDC050543 TaxID=3364054 RepID=UPI0037A7B20F